MAPIFFWQLASYLDAVHQQDDQNNDGQQAESAAGIVAPTTAVGKDRGGAECEQKKNDEKNQHGGSLLSNSCAQVARQETRCVVI